MFDPRIYLLSERLSGNVLMGKVSDEEFIKALCKCDVYSIDHQGAQVGGAILNGDRFHLTVLPEYQGKVGLVLKKGPLAYVDDDKTSFGGQNIDVGEWTVFRSSDGWTLQINGVLCRMLQDVQIKMAVPKPDIVF